MQPSPVRSFIHQHIPIGSQAHLSMSSPDFDSIRGTVLDRMERENMWLKVTIGAAAVAEVLLLVLVLWLADFHDRTHVLIVVSAVLTYTIVALGLVALGVHVSRAVSVLAAALHDHAAR